MGADLMPAFFWARAISLKVAWAAAGGGSMTEAQKSKANELNDLRSQRSTGGMRLPAEGLWMHPGIRITVHVFK